MITAARRGALRLPMALALLLVAAPARAVPDPCPAVPGPALPAAALTLPASAAALRAGGPLTVLAFGSSSTEGAGASGPEATYPARLEVLLRAALPGAAITVLNRGRGGEDAPEMLARLDRAVLAARPDLVIWQAGANAALRGADPDGFRATMAGGLARLRAAGVEVVLMDSQIAPRILARPDHPRFEAAIAALAGAQGVGLFSRSAAMRGWEAAGVPPAALLVDDGLHHNDRGYACVAAALADALLPALRGASVLAAGR